MSREGFDVVTAEIQLVGRAMLRTYLVMSVITIFVCNTGGGGGGRRRLLYNFENSISTSGPGINNSPGRKWNGKNCRTIPGELGLITVEWSHWSLMPHPPARPGVDASQHQGLKCF